MTDNAGFRYETHLHTREGSACGTSTGAEHVQAHIQAGYSGMVVTDHFFNGNCAVDRSLPWPERVHAFCLGYERALDAADGQDFDVFFGLEYNSSGTEFLTYGLDKDFLLDNPDMLSWTVEEYCDRAHAAGGFIIHAHPFRIRPYISEVRLFTRHIDAVEVENRGNDQELFDRQAYAYAGKHDLPMTKGSDLHGAAQIRGDGGMVFSERPKNIFDMIEMIKRTRSSHRPPSHSTTVTS